MISRKDAKDVLLEVAKTTGWSDEDLLDVLADFIQARGLTQDLETVLWEIAQGDQEESDDPCYPTATR